MAGHIATCKRCPNSFKSDMYAYHGHAPLVTKVGSFSHVQKNHVRHLVRYFFHHLVSPFHATMWTGTSAGQVFYIFQFFRWIRACWQYRKSFESGMDAYYVHDRLLQKVGVIYPLCKRTPVKSRVRDYPKRLHPWARSFLKFNASVISNMKFP